MEQSLYSTEVGFSLPPEAKPTGDIVTLRSEGRFPASGETVSETLPGLFAKRLAAWPERIAVSAGAATLSYRELDSQAEALSARLRTRGAGPGAIIGLCLPRSPDLVVALLAILKTGAAYLPLDPAYPAERLAFMVADAGAALVIGAPGALGWLPPGTPALDPGAQEEPSGAAPGPDAVPHDLAYLIYTSGSTGRPKGVAVEHAAVLRLFSSTQAWFGFGPDDVWTLFHSASFDFSVWEIWGALLHGGRLVIVPEETTRDPAAFLHLLHDEGVTVLNQTPSAFYALDCADEDRNGAAALQLRLVIFGGEALEPRRLAHWYMRRGEHAQLVNMYGITETTVHVSYRALHPADCLHGGSPIGEPIPDLEMLLLDGQTLQPVAPGEIGEIFVGGAGLARGYHNRPELTAARFIPHPGRVGARLYRSGDLARRMPDGGFEHLGRADQQIKIRGFRVERGEIETALLGHDGIRQAAVALDESGSGQPRLVAYIVAENGRTPKLAAMRRHLARTLPEHMVPDHFVQVPHLPLTVNGKLDHAALQALRALRPDDAYTAPRNAAESGLAQTIAAVLQLDQIGLDDNFFDLGGNSLLMVELHRRLKPDASALALIDLYRHPNLRALSAHLARAPAMPASAPSAALAAAMARGARSRSIDTGATADSRHE